MYSSLDEYIAGLFTRGEVLAFLNEVETLGESVYKTGDDGLEKVLRSKVGAKSADIILEELGKLGKLSDPQFQEQFFREIKEKLKNIPVVNLELAEEPSREDLRLIKDKLTECVNSLITIDYKVVPEMMAGIRVAFGGRYFDYSVESKWPEIWSVVKDKITPKA